MLALLVLASDSEAISRMLIESSKYNLNCDDADRFTSFARTNHVCDDHENGIPLHPHQLLRNHLFARYQGDGINTLGKCA